MNDSEIEQLIKDIKDGKIVLSEEQKNILQDDIAKQIKNIEEEIKKQENLH